MKLNKEQYTLLKAKKAWKLKKSSSDWLANADYIYNLIVKNNYKDCLEVGVGNGESTRVLISSVFKTNGNLVCYENNDICKYCGGNSCWFDHFKIEEEIEYTDLYNHIIYFESDFFKRTENDVPLFGNINKKPKLFDFIHGDYLPGHCTFEPAYQSTKFFLEKTILLLKKRGIISIHDVDDCIFDGGVNKAIEDFVKDKNEFTYSKKYFNKWGIGIITRVEK